MRPTPLTSLLALLAFPLAVAAADWPIYGADSAGTKYSALDQINRDNVKQLAPAWIYRCDDMTPRPASTIECNPIVIEGIAYLTTPGLKLAALDAATGKEKWRFDPWEGARGRGVNRGVTYWASGADRRIFFVAGNTLHALNAADGQPVRTFGREGKIDLREGLDRDVFFLSVSATTPGIIYRDLLILGSIVGEGPTPAAPGHIRAFDVRTGERKWIFHTIPHPGEFGYDTWSPDSWKTVGGANCWGGMTIDLERGLVFAGTGAPSYDHYGGNRIGANLFANCVLALRAATGERVWHYQVLHHDIWDYDIPCPPNLVTVQHNGRRIDAVAQVTKMGLLFVLDRETGKPLFPVEERPVPQSDLPTEVTWPTQPFPVAPPPFAQQRFTKDEVTDLNPKAREAILAQIEKMKLRLGDTYLPPTLTPSVALPQFNGGGEWGGASFDPQTRTLYVNASNEAEWISMAPAKPRGNVTAASLGASIYGAVCSACHGFDRPANANAPSFGSLKNLKERLTPEQVLALLETGRGQMPSFASFSAVEKRAVVSFLFSEGAEEKIDPADLKQTWAGDIPYVSTGHHEFRDPEGFPANKRPWGTLTAIDLDRGTFRWQVPLGTYPELEKRGEPPTGTFNMGGSLVTAGGLVFIGAAMDERMHAYDKATGKLLWEFQMEAGGYATPSTYSINGRQYVLIAAGGGGKPETKAGNAYYCFTLPEKK